MYGPEDQALYVLDNAAQVRQRADVVWRSAIREAIASNAPIEQVAVRAKTTIEDVLAIINEPFATRSSTADEPYAREFHAADRLLNRRYAGGPR